MNALTPYLTSLSMDDARIREYVVRRLFEERKRQDELHGEHNAGVPFTDFEWIGIMSEELGEASQALQYLRRQDAITDEVLDFYEDEVVQVMATACQLLERICRDRS